MEFSHRRSFLALDIFILAGAQTCQLFVNPQAVKRKQILFYSKDLIC